MKKMKKMKWTVTTVAVCVLVMASAAATQATSLRAFVASYGSDANLGANCPQATPCRTFNVAIGAVTPGGELIALDTAGYGPITSVNKAITIAALPGETAFVVSATGTAGFTIAGAAGDLIKLRNITFNGSGAASTTGIQHNTGKLVVEDCSFQQLTTGLAAASAQGAFVANSSFHGNGNGLLGSAGKIHVAKSRFTYNSTRAVRASGTGLIALQDVQVSNNNVGIEASGIGGCASANPVQPPTTGVWIELGSVANNATAFFMAAQGPGCPNGASHGQNIFMRNDGGTATALTPNLINNAVVLNVSGVASGTQVIVGTYQTFYFGNQP